jgi:hypothetical protein
MDKFVEVIYVPGIDQRIVSGTLFVSVVDTLLYRWLIALYIWRSFIVVDLWALLDVEFDMNYY